MEMCLYHKVYSVYCNLCVVIKVLFKFDQMISKCIKMSHLTSVSPGISSENVMPVAGTTFEAPS
jgi:hypothetical protein